MKNKHLSINRYTFITLEFFVVVAVFGSLIFVYLYSILQIPFFLYATAIKDISLYCVILCCLFSFTIKNRLAVNRDLFSLWLIFFFYVLFLFVNILVNKPSISTIALLCRRYLTPLLVILLFSSIKINNERILKFIITVTFILIVFGLFEYFVLNDYFWDKIVKIPKFWKDSNDPWARDSVAQSGRFYSYDLVFVTGNVTPRMVSSFTEPTNLASFLISVYIILVELKKYRLFCLFVMLSVFFTISKAAILDIFIIIPLLKVFRRLFPKSKYSTVFLLIFAEMYLVSYFFISVGLSSGPFSHINGYYTGINSILSGNIFGHGLGRSGNYAEIANSNDGVESGLGGMFAQTGLVGILFLLFFYKLIRYLEKDEKNNRIAIMLVFAWIVILIFSESSFGISGNMLFWVFPGIYFGKTIDKKQIV